MTRAVETPSIDYSVIKQLDPSLFESVAWLDDVLAGKAGNASPGEFTVEEQARGPAGLIDYVAKTVDWAKSIDAGGKPRPTSFGESLRPDRVAPVRAPAPNETLRLRVVTWALKMAVKDVTRQSNPELIERFLQGTPGGWCADMAVMGLIENGAAPSDLPWRKDKKGRDVLWQGQRVHDLHDTRDVRAWAEKNGRVVEKPRVGDLMTYPIDPATGYGHTMIVVAIKPDGTILAVGGDERTEDGVEHVWLDSRDTPPGTMYLDPYPR